MSIKVKNDKSNPIFKKELQPPFRRKDLLTATSFISYCFKYGIKTDELELEYFEKEGLLLPAVRVNRDNVVPWKDYDNHTTWAMDYRDLGNAYETFYSTLQMYPLIDLFRNKKIEFGFNLQNIQTVFKTFQIHPAYE